jgi:hypothetical protein
MSPSLRIRTVRVRYWTTLLSVTLYRSMHAYAHELDVAKELTSKDYDTNRGDGTV